LTKLEALLAEREALVRERDALKRQLLLGEKEKLLQRRQKVQHVSVVCARLDLSGEDLKALADLIEPEIAPGVALLGGVASGKVSLVCKVSEALTKTLHAGQIIKSLGPLIKGGGGGNARFAAGGGSNPQGLDEALRLGEEEMPKTPHPTLGGGYSFFVLVPVLVIPLFVVPVVFVLVVFVVPGTLLQLDLPQGSHCRSLLCCGAPEFRELWERMQVSARSR
jgi:hypothetical protein